MEQQGYSGVELSETFDLHVQLSAGPVVTIDNCVWPSVGLFNLTTAGRKQK